MKNSSVVLGTFLMIFAFNAQARLTSISYAKEVKVGIMGRIFNHCVDNYFHSFPTTFKTHVFLNVIGKDIYRSSEYSARADTMTKNIAKSHGVYEPHLIHLVRALYGTNIPYLREGAYELIVAQLKRSHYNPNLLLQHSTYFVLQEPYPSLLKRRTTAPIHKFE